jgi:homospermidine synthase
MHLIVGKSRAAFWAGGRLSFEKVRSRAPNRKRARNRSSPETLTPDRDHYKMAFEE